MIRPIRKCRVAPLMLLCAVCMGCGSGDSPKAAYDALTEAARKNDYREYCKYLTTESVDQMVIGLLGGAEATVVTYEKKIVPQSDEDREKYHRVVKVLAKHEVDPKRASANPDISDRASGAEYIQALMSQQKAEANRIKDKPAFIQDMMEAFETESSRKSMDEARSKPVPTMDNIVIDGDRASGSYPYFHNGETLTITNHFRKVDGAWKVDLMPQK